MNHIDVSTLESAIVNGNMDLNCDSLAKAVRLTEEFYNMPVSLNTEQF